MGRNGGRFGRNNNGGCGRGRGRGRSNRNKKPDDRDKYKFHPSTMNSTTRNATYEEVKEKIVHHIQKKYTQGIYLADSIRDMKYIDLDKDKPTLETSSIVVPELADGATEDQKKTHSEAQAEEES